jgi:hypothetical protein
VLGEWDATEVGNRTELACSLMVSFFLRGRCGVEAAQEAGPLAGAGADVADSVRT